jgi:hypothetical protein
VTGKATETPTHVKMAFGIVDGKVRHMLKTKNV